MTTMKIFAERKKNLSSRESFKNYVAYPHIIAAISFKSLKKKRNKRIKTFFLPGNVLDYLKALYSAICNTSTLLGIKFFARIFFFF